jgi:two-component system chemotaxis response regulator CheB
MGWQSAVGSRQIATYDLVVIGASWGGLQALERLLGALPGEFATPIVVAQHRAIDSDGAALPGILERRTGRTVLEAADKDPIERGHVYLAPADYHLLVEPDGFALSTEGAVQHSRPSIDVLFDSAADVYADRLVAVILTGANEDGAYGIRRVRRRGGMTVAQDPRDAAKAEMPAAAVATGAVQHVVPLDEIAPLLAQLAGGTRSAA